MHYDGTLRGRFSYPIMTDKITGKGIEVNRKMSTLDIQKLNKMYPCQPTGPVCGEFLLELCDIVYVKSQKLIEFLPIL